ncbi:MAG: serine/threonine-protein kinase [Ilumatobacteraceae bacterium]
MVFEVGHVVERYRIDYVVHSGRFTVVYAATDLTLGRKTALKVLSDHYAPDPNFRERFAREVQVAASLDAHPNMVPVYGSGEADGTLFLATQFIEGVTLEELVRQQPGGEPLPLVEALEYLHEIASALDFANSRRFVHRDVKPGNVLIGLVETPHRAYLVDFGVAKDIAENAKATQHGLFLGTAEYASPEQIHGAELDARSDVYSLACTAFELLTGSSPFAAGPDDSALIAAHLQSPIPSAVERRPSLPDAVDRVLALGLSKDAAGRPPSAGEFVQALGDAFAESTILFARPTDAGAELPPPAPAARRRWWIPAAIAGGVVALLAASVLVVRAFDDGEAGPATIVEPSSTTLPAATTLPATTQLPATTAPPTLPPVPPGALDLGFGAYVPLAQGWQVATLDANAAELTDGVTTVSFVVQQRPPGSAARDVLLEQVGTVDSAFPAVWYGIPTVQPGTGGAMASQRSSVGYRAYGDGGATSGQALGLVRADGLAVGYVQRAVPGAASSGYPGLEQMVASLLAAPAVATPAEIADPGTAAVPSSHPQLPIDGPASFTPGPSYRVVDAQPGYAFLTADGAHDVIARSHVVSTPGDVVALARQGVSDTYPGATFGTQTDFGPDTNAIIHSSVDVSATYFDGQPLVGTIDTYWDPVTTHGYWFARMWFVTEDGVEPFAGQVQWMASLLYDSFLAT